MNLLQANTKDGEQLTLALLSRNHIEWHRKHSTFFCPICGEKVIIKAGQKVVPHFAHQSRSNCPNIKSGEGPYHEHGKLLLYKWLKKQQLPVRLEPFIREISQRPDLILQWKNKRLAIEYQCATISNNAVIHRNNGYYTSNIIPIWIFGANQFQRLNQYSIKIKSFMKQCLLYLTPNPSLFFFCPLTNQIVTINDIFFTSSNKIIGKITFHKLYDIHLQQLFINKRLSPQKLQSLWKREKHKFRLNVRRRLYGMELAWHNWLYSKNIHFELLPSVVYLPTTSQHLMKSQPWNWQSRICLDIIQPLPIGGKFTLKQCMKLLYPHLLLQTTSPLNQEIKHPVFQYLLLLDRLNIVKRVTVDQFIKVRSLTFYENVKEALYYDHLIVKELFGKRRHE